MNLKGCFSGTQYVWFLQLMLYYRNRRHFYSKKVEFSKFFLRVCINRPLGLLMQTFRTLMQRTGRRGERKITQSSPRQLWVILDTIEETFAFLNGKQINVSISKLTDLLALARLRARTAKRSNSSKTNKEWIQNPVTESVPTIRRILRTAALLRSENCNEQ